MAREAFTVDKCGKAGFIVVNNAISILVFIVICHGQKTTLVFKTTANTAQQRT